MILSLSYTDKEKVFKQSKTHKPQTTQRKQMIPLFWIWTIDTLVKMVQANGCKQGLQSKTNWVESTSGT